MLLVSCFHGNNTLWLVRDDREFRNYDVEACGEKMMSTYRQVSNIRRTKSQHLKDYRTVLRLSLPNPMKPAVKSRMKM